MTEAQRETAVALGRCSFLPASGEKRFAHDMAALAARDPAAELSDKQARYLQVLAYKFRRQMPAKLVPAEKPE